MEFKLLKYFSMVSILLVSTPIVHAAPVGWIDNGGFTTDGNTGVDWLDLSYTVNQSYTGVASNFGDYEGGGWRYAANDEVVSMLSSWMPNIPGMCTAVAPDRCWLAADVDAEFGTYYNLAFEFFNSFGLTNTYISTDEPWREFFQASGVYKDADNNLSLSTVAVATGINDDPYYDPYQSSVQWYVGYPPNSVWSDSSVEHVGIYLVRDVSAVPIPAALWLFGSGLIGLIGLARRKKA